MSMKMGQKLQKSLRLKCQNMACLGKICVNDPIEACLSGFDCDEQFNCVHPGCGSELQSGFGICLPLVDWIDSLTSLDVEIYKYIYKYKNGWFR